MIPISITEFHTATKNFFKETIKRVSPDQNLYPDEWKTTNFKVYERFSLVHLPEPLHIDTPFNFLFKERKSHRSFDQETRVDIHTISTILHASFREIDAEASSGRGRRSVASAGARFPLEMYVFISRDIEGLSYGIYHYRPDIHALEIMYLPKTKNSVDLSRLTSDPIADTYPVYFFITAVFERSTIKYKDRAYRYILLEAGAVGQAIQNAATFLEGKSLIFGGTFDDEVEKLLEIDGISESLVNTVLLK